MDDYLNKIDYIIKDIDRFIIEKTKTNDLMVGASKIKEFKDINNFILEINDENIYKNIFEQIELLNVQMDNFTAKDVSSNFKEEDLKRLLITYFLLLKTDIDKTLSIDPNQLYLTLNAMRGISYNKYLECINKLTYPKLVEVINNEGATNKTRIILNALTNTIGNKESDYDASKIDNDMNEFLTNEVYSRIKPLLVGSNNDLLVLLEADKNYNLRNIKNAERVNPTLYKNNYEDKLEVLEQYQHMDVNTVKKYLDIIKYLKEKTDSKAFAMTELELIILGIMNYIDINEVDKDDLYSLIIGLKNTPYQNYQDILTSKKKVI